MVQTVTYRLVHEVVMNRRERVNIKATGLWMAVPYGASHGRITVGGSRWITRVGGWVRGCLSLATRTTPAVSHGARALKSWWRPATNNPHDKTKPTNLKLEIYLDRLRSKMRMSIFSPGLYQGEVIPIFGNQSSGPTAGVGGSQGCDALFASPFFTRSPHL